MKDWLVAKNIDILSSKFDLTKDIVIIEFRDFPSHMYIDMYINGGDEIRRELSKKNIGTLSMDLFTRFVDN